MGLTSAGFIILLAVLALASGAVTVRLWPRLAATGVKPVLGRIGMLTLTQVMALVTVLAVTNRHYVFYSGWGDLLGTDTSQAQIKVARARIGGPGAHPAPNAQVIIKPLGVKHGHRDPIVDGSLDAFHFRGRATGLSADAYVMLPPQYYQPAYARTKFPVVVMMTGYPGHPAALLSKMRFPDMVREGARSGTVRPAVYVLMRPTIVPPRDTECTDVPRGPQVETFLADDVPAAVQAHFRVATTRDGWGIMGDSTGGYCAVKLAMRHVESFSTAVSLSGYFKSLQDMTTGDLYGGSQAVRDENDLLWRERHRPTPPVSVLVASCKIGEKTYPQAVEFVRLARPPMQVATYYLDSGGHNFRTFGRMIPAALRWMSEHLKAE